MDKRKPLEYATDNKTIELFTKKMRQLGYLFESIGKPETISLAAQTEYEHSPVLLKHLTEESLNTIETFLEQKDADGGLILNSDSRRGHSETHNFLVLTILPYKLIPYSPP